VIDDVSRAYSRRAAEYTELFGSMGSVHPSDRQLVSTWADGIDGAVLDAGCGPGQWTDLLTRLGLDARGVDLVPEFIERARNAYPAVPFSLGSLDDLNPLGVVAESLGGLLAWYSLIHHEPPAIRMPLREFHRVLKPHGLLLIGFFEGPALEAFPHAVIRAYRWPVDALAEALADAGFDVVESHVRVTTGQRPQAAIIARRRDAPVES
jgi:SAM-dependent methyltransferase